MADTATSSSEGQNAPDDEQDRSTYMGAVHRLDEDVKVPKQYNEPVVFDDKAEFVDVFQVASSNFGVALRFDGDVVYLSGEQCRAFAAELRNASINVVS